MTHETHRMELMCDDLDHSFGKIELDQVADPKTVEVLVKGRKIKPCSFDIYGNPIFTDEIATLLYWEENQIRRKPESSKFLIEVEVYYEPISQPQVPTFDLINNMYRFNSSIDLESSLKSLKAFSEYLREKRRFSRIVDNHDWNEFVIWGKYLIDSFCQIWTITETDIQLPKNCPKVMTKSEFIEMCGGYSASGGTCIPSSKAKCPCCGKRFTIKDIRVGLCVNRKGKTFHDECYRNFEHYRVINEFTDIIDSIYKGAPYDIIPNGYCSRPCHSHLPWFIFHTPDGDIEIGWRKRVISIEWKENFKPFSMEIFKSEEVTKGIRSIHAWGREKAHEYLKKVRDEVNKE